MCTINVTEMTVVMDNKPNEILILKKDPNYQRPHEISLNTDAIVIRPDWPKEIGEYAHLWA